MIEGEQFESFTKCSTKFDSNASKFQRFIQGIFGLLVIEILQQNTGLLKLILNELLRWNSPLLLFV